MRIHLVLGISTLSLVLTFGAGKTFSQTVFSRTPQAYHDSFREMSERQLYRLAESRRGGAFPNRAGDAYNVTRYAVQPVACGNSQSGYLGSPVQSAYRPLFDDRNADIRRHVNYRPVAGGHHRTPVVVPGKYYAGENIYGRPSVYGTNQPVRNFFRSLIP